ncbi:MAG: SUMF1/EgtB/PvdO family nonheme iron enzyme [Planctomycetota bacterium]|nr:SUMF1/EgtB/PvdO family nonheme iron enzyme [Planctomycetota bacterium]
MTDVPRQKLAEMLSRYGREICSDPKRCKAYLNDVCGAHVREINLLVTAVEEGVATELRDTSSSVPKNLLLAKLIKRLVDNRGLAEDLARRCVESWALALGVIPSIEPVGPTESGTGRTAAVQHQAQVVEQLHRLAREQEAEQRQARVSWELNRQTRAHEAGRRNAAEGQNSETERAKSRTQSPTQPMYSVAPLRSAIPWSQQRRSAVVALTVLLLILILWVFWGGNEPSTTPGSKPASRAGDTPKTPDQPPPIPDTTTDSKPAPTPTTTTLTTMTPTTWMTTQSLKPSPLAKVIFNSIGMEFVLIPPGEFEMGARDDEKGDPDEYPRHRVRISRMLWVGRHEVTQGQYQQVVGTNPSYFSSQGGGRDRVQGVDTRRLPVESVSWFDCVEFANALSRLENLNPCYRIDNANRSGATITDATVEATGGGGYRLLTEAEWEFVARAGTSTVFPWGNSLSSAQANFGNHLEQTTPVGSYPPNPWNLCDVEGNVCEWVWDCYADDAYKRSVGQNMVDWQVSSGGVKRVVRGGGWASRSEQYCRLANRDCSAPYWYPPMSHVGFRLAREAPAR